jgi:hypothetical protein
VPSLAVAPPLLVTHFFYSLKLFKSSLLASCSWRRSFFLFPRNFSCCRDTLGPSLTVPSSPVMSTSSSKGASPPAVDSKPLDSKQLESNQLSSVEDSADHLLETLGYTPELSRNRSTAQVAFMSFVLASIPYGLATTLYYPLLGGGPVDIIWGWVLVSLIIICVAASLGEITSVYPTAGGISRQFQSFFFSFCFWVLRRALRIRQELSRKCKI